MVEGKENGEVGVWGEIFMGVYVEGGVKWVKVVEEVPKSTERIVVGGGEGEGFDIEEGGDEDGRATAVRIKGGFKVNFKDGSRIWYARSVF